MDVGDQYAEGDIYNIANLNLAGGTINAGRVYVQADASNIESQQALTAQFKVSYLDFLIDDHGQRNLLDRPSLDEIISLLSNQSDLAIIGVPGVGKTSILYQLSKKLSDVIYISLKGKSLLTIVAHVVNKINLANSLPLQQLTDGEAALEVLQGQLISSKAVIMIDDCEADDNSVRKLLTLRKFSNKFIYASRSDHEFILQGLEPYRLKEFSIEEVEEFLSIASIQMDLMSINELYEASNGNALYLYYFSKFQITPLPRNISDYHNAIWANLNAQQQQCLIYIALSYKPPQIHVIKSLLNFDLLTEAINFIGTMDALVKNNEGRYEIFHLAFKEFIITWLTNGQVIAIYRTELGDYYLKAGDYLQATHLLIDQNPGALRDITSEVVYQLITDGDLTFATKVMAMMLAFAKTNLEKGYLHYHLAFNFKMLGEHEKAASHQEQSMLYFGKLKNRSWYNIALMNKAISLVEDGKPDEGLAIADKILSKSASFSSSIQGQFLVSISKIYVDLHESERAANASFRAYRFFEKEKHVSGMILSLANLASALARLNGYNSVAEEYALSLLRYTNKGFSFHIELIALNILTSVNRQKKNYADAKRYGEKAIRLCQHYKLENKAVLNLINYGNVLRDNNETEQANKVYQEALLATDRLGLTKDESRIYWILAEMFLEQLDFKKAIENINLSIEKAEQINYRYGIAHGYEDKANILKQMGDLRSSAENYSKSTLTFQTLSDFKRERAQTLQKAVLLYLEIGDSKAANDLLRSSAETLQATGFVELNTLINAPKINLDIHSYFKFLTSSYVKTHGDTNLTQEYIMYLEYCLTQVQESKKKFNEVVQILASTSTDNQFAKSILAMLIEQSKGLVDGRDFESLLETLTTSLSGFYAREIAHETIILLKLPNSIKLEIVAYTEDLISLKLGISLSLFLSASPDLLALEKPMIQDFCKVHLIMRKDVRNLFPKITLPELDNLISTYHLEKTDHAVPNYIVVHEKYENDADLVANINNRHFMYFLNMSIWRLIANYYRLKGQAPPQHRKRLFAKTAFLLGMTTPEEIKSGNATYKVDLSKLDELVGQYVEENGKLE